LIAWYNALRGSDGEERFPDRQARTPENRREGQALPLRRVPPKKPQARQDPCPVVLSDLPEYEWGIAMTFRAASLRRAG
jgi:hypothetical protein